MSDPLHARIAAVLLVDGAGRLLLQLRDAHAANSPNQWGLPGGHIEPGETPEQAARRELLEETGLTVAGPLRSFWQGMRPSVSRPDLLTEWHVFCATTRARQEDLVRGEGQALRFIAPSAVAALDLAQNEADLVPRFLASADYQRLRAAALDTGAAAQGD